MLYVKEFREWLAQFDDHLLLSDIQIGVYEQNIKSKKEVTYFAIGGDPVKISNTGKPLKALMLKTGKL